MHFMRCVHNSLQVTSQSHAAWQPMRKESVSCIIYKPPTLNCYVWHKYFPRLLSTNCSVKLSHTHKKKNNQNEHKMYQSVFLFCKKKKTKTKTLGNRQSNTGNKTVRWKGTMQTKPHRNLRVPTNQAATARFNGKSKK